MAENDAVSQDEYDLANPRWHLSVRLRDVILRRWSAEVRAIGVHGSLAHGDDTDSSDLNLHVVTDPAPPCAGSTASWSTSASAPPTTACAGPGS
jgi:hypothetical protein